MKVSKGETFIITEGEYSDFSYYVYVACVDLDLDSEVVEYVRADPSRADCVFCAYQFLDSMADDGKIALAEIKTYHLGDGCSIGSGDAADALRAAGLIE